MNTTTDTAKRMLRLSGYNDYLAIDIVKNNIIIETPFSLNKNKVAIVKYKDTEDYNYYKAEVTIKPDFSCLIFKDVDPNSYHIGMVWESEFDELENEYIVKFI